LDEVEDVPPNVGFARSNPYLRRASHYLGEQVRRGLSVWTRVGPAAEERRCAAAAMTLRPAGGPRNRDLVALDAAAFGLRLVIA
jgi:hypothetical protein